MSEKDFETYNEARDPAYQKDEQSEDFLKGFNRTLYEKEKEEYEEHPVQHPFIFVVGAPRSGTTLLTQALAHSLDLSYIDNLAARFFLAPLHGMRFSKAVFGTERRTDHRSNYASTQELSDIHEFGYFWRDLLQKKSFDDITYCKEREDRIDRDRVKKVLSTMQREAGRPMVFKNIMGGYHMGLLQRLLGKVLFVHIVRDETDSALSILGARRKYNKELKTWWSYQPIEYEALKDRDPYEQIAGQVHCLRRFYRKEMEGSGPDHRLELSYRSLCQDPQSVIEQVRERVEALGAVELPYYQAPPESFPFRSYEEGYEEEKERFAKAFRRIRKEFPV